jgi:polyisoprenoid-binding protein YceI
MNNNIVLILLFINLVGVSTKKTSNYITRLGQVTFFSHTDVENIEAVNNQTLCILDIDTGDIALNILMKAFVFENELMREHFNKSYIESDLYPKATFRGKIIDFDPTQSDTQVRMIEGQFTLKDKTAPLAFKVKIDNTNDGYTMSGTAEVFIENYTIKIPKLLSPNIAKSLDVSFNFEFIMDER